MDDDEWEFHARLAEQYCYYTMKHRLPEDAEYKMALDLLRCLGVEEDLK